MPGAALRALFDWNEPEQWDYPMASSPQEAEENRKEAEDNLLRWERGEELRRNEPTDYHPADKLFFQLYDRVYDKGGFTELQRSRLHKLLGKAPSDEELVFKLSRYQWSRERPHRMIRRLVQPPLLTRFINEYMG